MQIRDESAFSRTKYAKDLGSFFEAEFSLSVSCLAAAAAAQSSNAFLRERTCRSSPVAYYSRMVFSLSPPLGIV